MQLPQPQPTQVAPSVSSPPQQLQGQLPEATGQQQEGLSQGEQQQQQIQVQPSSDNSRHQVKVVVLQEQQSLQQEQISAVPQQQQHGEEGRQQRQVLGAKQSGLDQSSLLQGQEGLLQSWDPQQIVHDQQEDDWEQEKKQEQQQQQVGWQEQQQQQPELQQQQGLRQQHSAWQEQQQQMEGQEDDHKQHQLQQQEDQQQGHGDDQHSQQQLPSVSSPFAQGCIQQAAVPSAGLKHVESLWEVEAAKPTEGGAGANSELVGGAPQLQEEGLLPAVDVSSKLQEQEPPLVPQGPSAISDEPLADATFIEAVRSLKVESTYLDIKGTLQSYKSKCEMQEAACLAGAATAGGEGAGEGLAGTSQLQPL
jgi:hypothetical protein